MDTEISSNRLLGRLTEADRGRVLPHLEEQPLAFKQTLFEQDETITHVHFPASGVVSLVTVMADGEAIETGTVGSEGVAGLPLVLGIARAPGRAICQIPGRGWRLPAHILAEERKRSSAWFSVLLRYANFVNVMVAQAAACNRMHMVDARMCRWLLMTHDRVQGDEFVLTQDFLAQMLGVARPSVNIAGATLQRAGFIEYTRGRITVLDRAGLESGACECYGRIREQLEVALGADD